MKVKTYSAKGTKGTDTNLSVKDGDVNKVLLAQAMRVYEARKHPSLSMSQTRGEVTASTRKIYRQKGTGRARHGALSAPIFVGGGKAHGPRGVKRVLSLPKKMRVKALESAMRLKAKEEKIVVVSGLSDLKKTKDAATLLDKIAKAQEYKSMKNVTVFLDDKNAGALRMFRNIKGVSVLMYKDLNTYSVMTGGVIVFDKDALGAKKKEADTKSKKTTKTKESNSKKK